MKDLQGLIRDNKELDVLNAISSLTCQSLDINKILNDVLDLVLTLFNAETGTIMLLDDASGLFQLQAYRGISQEFSKSISRKNLDECAAQLAISKKSPVFMKISEYPEIPMRDAIRKEGIKWIISTPLLRSDEIMGIVNIAGKKAKMYSAHDMHLLSLISNRISISIENHKLLKESRERSAQMASLLKTGALLISSLHIEETMNKIVEEAAKLVGTEVCSIFFYDPENNLITGQVAYGIPDEMIKMISFPLDLFPAAQEALTKKRVIALNDPMQDPAVPSPLRDIFGSKSSLVIPLFFAESPLGILLLQETKYRKNFSSSEIELATNFAHYVSIAIQNARLYTEAMSRREQAEAVQLIGQALTSRLDYQEVLKNIANYARQIAHAKFAFVSMKEEYYFRTVAIAGEDEGYASTIRFTDDPHNPLGLGPWGRAARSKVPAVISDCEKDPTFAPWREDANGRGIRSTVSIPLISKGTTFGVLSVSSTQPAFFDKKRVTLLTSFANFAAIAMENSRLYHELKLAFDNLKEAQNRLVQTEKLSAIGEMVAGVAHEINNPLTAVLGFSQLLLGHECDNRIKAKLMKINDEAARCAKIVQNLLAFARKQKPEKRYIGINGIIESVLEMRSYQLKVDKIDVVKDLAPDLPKTMADYSQLQQVFLNIINNAHQAMSNNNGGRLTIRTKESGKKIHVIFQDSGPGISSDNLKKIFDPFFTTKPAGKGTGLGLSLCYGIMREHGGSIQVESEKGKGALFRLELPIVEDQNAPARGSETSKQPMRTTKKSLDILIVDDEEMIIELLFEYLTDLGHNTETAATGQAALEKIINRNYDLIFCDMKMPGLNGQELYKKIKEKKPEAAPKIIFSSGDTLTQSVRDFFKETGNIFISKPFNFQNILGIVNSRLSA